jgi:3-hydroxyisobutyrate dehydrogenase
MSEEISRPATIGFIGLGDMGAPMARSIARAGRDLTVYDVRTEATAGFADLGVKVAPSAEHLARSSDIVAFCVQSEKQVIQLVLEGGGLLDAMTSGQLLVMHSTVSPSLAARLAEAAQERGIGFLDAPVSGGSVQAREHGELAVFVGGTERDFERAQPLLAAVGQHVELLGPAGSGEVAKICNNLMLYCNTFASFEAARLASAYGIPADTMVRVALYGSARSWSLDEWGFWHRMIPNHPVGDSREAIIEFLEKDIRLAVEAARDADVKLPMGERAESIARNVIGEVWDEAQGSA